MNRVKVTGALLREWKQVPYQHYTDSIKKGILPHHMGSHSNYIFFTGRNDKVNYIKIIAKPEQARIIRPGDRVMCEGLIRSDYQEYKGNTLIHPYVELKKIVLAESIAPVNEVKVSGFYRPDIFKTEVKQIGMNIVASFVVECSASTMNAGGRILVPCSLWGSDAERIVRLPPYAPVTITGAISSRFYYTTRNGEERKKNIIEVIVNKFEEGNKYAKDSEPKDFKPRKL